MSSFPCLIHPPPPPRPIPTFISSLLRRGRFRSWHIQQHTEHWNIYAQEQTTTKRKKPKQIFQISSFLQKTFFSPPSFDIMIRGPTTQATKRNEPLLKSSFFSKNKILTSFFRCWQFLIFSIKGKEILTLHYIASYTFSKVSGMEGEKAHWPCNISIPSPLCPLFLTSLRYELFFELKKKSPW